MSVTEKQDKNKYEGKKSNALLFFEFEAPAAFSKSSVQLCAADKLKYYICCL